MNSKLTILVITVDVVGRVNSCTGVTSGLLKRGHRVVFLTEESFKGRLESLGFEEYVYRMELDGSTQQQQQEQQKSTTATAKPGEKVANGMFANRIIGPYDPKEKFNNLLNLFVRSPNAGRRIIKSDQYIKEAIDAVKPNLIWFGKFELLAFICTYKSKCVHSDNTYLSPAIYYSNIPYVNNVSTTPLYSTFDETLQVPPGGSGMMQLTRSLYFYLSNNLAHY